jgi:hypothetical protein
VDLWLRKECFSVIAGLHGNERGMVDPGTRTGGTSPGISGCVANKGL